VLGARWSCDAVLEYFFPVRLEYYGLRKASMLDALRADLQRLDNRVRFILEVIDGSIVVSNRKKADLLQELVVKPCTFACHPCVLPLAGLHTHTCTVSDRYWASEETEASSNEKPV